MPDRVPIYQFWDANPPDQVVELMDTWKNAGNAFEYRFFDKAAALELISNNFGARIVSAFKRCAVPAMMADFFRYCALLTSGGIYADADTQHLGGIESLYHSSPRGLLFIRHDNVANDFMIVKRPNDPLMNFVLNRAVVNIEKRVSNDVWKVTGPGIMTKLRRWGSVENRSLFEEYELVSIQDVKKYVRFFWSLEYKKSDTHWTIVGNERSIYTD